MAEAVEICGDLFYVGIRDAEVGRYQGTNKASHGHSYNAYLLLGGKGKNVLFETVPEEHIEEFLSRVRSVLPSDECIDYIILNHAEPDHCGAVVQVMDSLGPNAEIVATRPALGFLQEIHNKKDFKTKVVTKNFILDAGKYTVKCFLTPFVQWPDTMFSVIESLGCLFSSDLFSSTYVDAKTVFAPGKGVQDLVFKKAIVEFFVQTLGLFSTHVRKAMVSVRNACPNFKFVLPAHGCVVREDLESLFALYDDLAKEKGRQNRVIIPIVSAYGFTKIMARFISDGVIAGGLEAEIIDGTGWNDESETWADCVVRLISTARGVLFGVPTYCNAVPKEFWELLGRLNPNAHSGMLCGAFGSFGWSGEATAQVFQRLGQIRGVALPLEPFKVKFRPSKDDEKRCVEFGELFAKHVHGEVVAKKAVAVSVKEQVKEEPPAKTKSGPLRYLDFKRDGKKHLWKCIVCGEVFNAEIPPLPCPACGAGAEAFVLLEEGEAPKKTVRELIPFTKFKPDGKKHMWKCVVCGEVFEGISPPLPCPACGAGAEAFVMVPDEQQSGPEDKIRKLLASATTPLRIVIVGGGPAAVAAAKAVVAAGRPLVKIIIVSEEKIDPYYRPSLSSFLTDPQGEHDPKFKIVGGNWFVDHSVEVMAGYVVTEIEPDARRVLVAPCDDEKNWEEEVTEKESRSATTILDYDRLIICSGSTAFVPVRSIPAKRSAKNIFVVRSLGDIHNLQSAVKEFKPKGAVLLGGGILSLEMASQLSALKINVTIVELFNQVAPPILDYETAGYLQRICEEKGVQFRLSTKVGSLEIMEDNMVRSVSLLPASSSPKKKEEMEVIPADLLIFSCGVRPRAKIAALAGISVKRGIVVDDQMRTGFGDVFAAGDVAEHNGQCVGTWSNATEQGTVAGLNAVGVNRSFVRSARPYMTEVFGVCVASVGSVRTSQADEGTYVAVSKSVSQRDILKLRFCNGILVGGMGVGKGVPTVDIAQAIDRRATLSEVQETILR